jgi:uncharacterized membrane protein
MSGGMIRRLISRFRAAKKVVFNRPSNSLRSALLSQHAVCLGIDLLFVGCAQFALMLHLGRASLRISCVTRIGHRIFTLLWQSEFLVWLRLLLRGCKFCHRTSP